MLTVVAAVAPQRRLQEGDEHQDDDGDEGQRDEDVLVDEEQAHFPHALARGLVNGTALQRKRAPWLCCRSMRGNVLVIAVGLGVSVIWVNCCVADCGTMDPAGVSYAYTKLNFVFR